MPGGSSPAEDGPDGDPSACSETTSAKALASALRRYDIVDPGTNDCLLGRGNGVNAHPGNVRFRALIESFKPRYAASGKQEKGVIAEEIVRKWRAQTPPGRFLKYDEKGRVRKRGMWYDVGDAKARAKTIQRLREHARPNFNKLGTGLPGKPKQPCSAYNLFCQMEREFIMREISEGRKPGEDPLIKEALEESTKAKAQQGGDTKNSERDSAKEESSDDKAVTSSLDPAKRPQPGAKGEGKSQFFYDPNIPARYAHLHMDIHWYSVGRKQKRKHRKTQGSCGFIELTKMVSARWKLIDKTEPYVKQYCQALADLELEIYKKEMANYKLMVEKAELEAKASP